MTDPHHSALTVVIPFATLILLGRKRWELRKMTCASAVGKKVPIIASKTHRIWGLVTVLVFSILLFSYSLILLFSYSLILLFSYSQSPLKTWKNIEFQCFYLC